MRALDNPSGMDGCSNSDSPFTTRGQDGHDCADSELHLCCFKRAKKMLKDGKLGVAVDIRLPEFLEDRAVE
jgi:hypothetical protein